MRHAFLSKTLLLAMFLVMINQTISAQTQESDYARIYKAMNKGRNGEDIKIGVLGGSITEGYAASLDAKRWSNLMADWWKTKFPDSKVELINAGWGGTGSDIGTHRAYDDLLVQQPDFMVVEFSVNDAEGALATKMMEGLVQQVLLAENYPGVMILMLKQDNGTTAQASHKPVGEHYAVPMVSFADLIDAKVAEDGVELSSIFVDGLHPNDAGMAYVAGFITDQLDSIYTTLPEEVNLPEIITELPAPIVTDIYSNTFQFFPSNIVPLSNQGWNAATSGWNTNVEGSQIDFKLMGNAVSVIFTQNINNDRGRAEVWVDEGEKTIIDAFMNEDWGTKYAFALVQEALSDEEHILHIRSISETSTSGNYVHIERIMVAGNVGSAAPIAKTSSYQKGVVGLVVNLDGTESFDPDGNDIGGYEWIIKEKPAGSSITISKANESTASFVPDVAGDYIIELTVSAGINSSVPALKKVSIRATNSKPIAVPGNDTISALGKYFRFDGTKSFDDDGDEITYKWVLESAPEGSETSIAGDDSDKPQCKFDINGDYVVSLVVFDSIDFSDKSFITVEGRDGYTSINQINKNLEWANVFPNPVSSNLNIQYFLQQPEIITLKLFTIQGQKITEVVYDKNTMGINKQMLNLNSLNTLPGVYLVTLSGAKYIKTIRTSLI
ncbi:MAG: GDSL-type esterase/lipase family protein [Salinivirgaceae bacterium]|jgi:acyl-CoA thioesterase-1|nr:GDSL-type esterase/lipase family protein [Salinivirgaceae bacterium]